MTTKVCIAPWSLAEGCAYEAAEGQHSTSNERDCTALVPAPSPLKMMDVETLILLFHKIEND